MSNLPKEERTDLQRAIEELAAPNVRCALVRGNDIYRSGGHGVQPLLGWVKEERDFSGYAAADQVVGKAAALLYVRLGVKVLHAKLLSKTALPVLKRFGIEISWEQTVPFVKNRAGTGMCPMELAVAQVEDPAEAVVVLSKQAEKMRQSAHKEDALDRQEQALRGDEEALPGQEQADGNLTLETIRPQIDQVDEEIKKLFITRMQLADQVATVKARTEDQIYKPDREASIIARQSQDMDAHLMMEYRALIKRIMEVSRKYQYGKTLQLRDCFPFTFEQHLPAIHHLGVVREELYLAMRLGEEAGEKTSLQEHRSTSHHLEETISEILQGTGSLHGVRSYSEMAQLIMDGTLQAGMGVIEHIGSGVCDELNSMLLRNRLYINDCRVISEGTQRVKIVSFTRHLTADPGHNRVKLVFVCPNRSGALGSIFSMIADYGVNVTEIHSIPFKTGEEDWNYRFFVELEMNPLQEDSRALLFQLSQETMQIQLLGSYCCEGDFVV